MHQKYRAAKVFSSVLSVFFLQCVHTSTTEITLKDHRLPVSPLSCTVFLLETRKKEFLISYIWR